MNHEWRQFDRDSRAVGGRSIGWTIVAVIFVILLIVGVWALTVAWAPWKGEGDQRKEVNSVDYRIAAYDSFYDQCAAIQAKEDQINNLLAEKPTDPARQQQVTASVTALRNSRASLIRSYNADASKTDTKANFLASDLPFSIDPTQESTTCAAS